MSRRLETRLDELEAKSPRQRVKAKLIIVSAWDLHPSTTKHRGLIIETKTLPDDFRVERVESKSQLDKKRKNGCEVNARKNVEG